MLVADADLVALDNRMAAVTISMIRSASAAAASRWLASPACRIANSSPPRRASTSVSRSEDFSRRRGLLQQRIAGRMPERVVDVLELVEVEHEDGERLAPPAQARARFLDLLHEERAVGQAGQQVVVRHVDDLRLGAPALGDVLDDASRYSGFPSRTTMAFGRHQAHALAGRIDPCCSNAAGPDLQQVACRGRRSVGGAPAEQTRARSCRSPRRAKCRQALEPPG